MKRLLTFLFAILICAMVFAQDSTGGGTSGGFQLPSWATTAGLIILAVYEVVARFVPTIKNYSIIGFIITVIQKIIPNKSSTSNKLP